PPIPAATSLTTACSRRTIARSRFLISSYGHGDPRHLHSFPTRRSSDLPVESLLTHNLSPRVNDWFIEQVKHVPPDDHGVAAKARSEEHTSELQSRFDLVCRLLLEKKKA